MKREQLVAQAVLSWLAASLHPDRAVEVAREGLPQLDIAYFLRGLAKLDGLDAGQLSLALAGFELNTTELRAIAKRNGLNRLNALADDLHTAASWRNDRRNHPQIIALARGKHPGVHTLKHFTTASSRELAQALLEWAAAITDFANTGPQRDLLLALARNPELASLCSLEQVVDFLITWTDLRKRDPNGAARRALPELGILADPNLFDRAHKVEVRLVQNMAAFQEVINLSPYQMRDRRRQLESRRASKARSELLDILGRVEKLRQQPTSVNRGRVTLAETISLLRPAKSDSKQESQDPSPETGSAAEENDPPELGQAQLASFGADALLDNRQDDLELQAEQLGKALEAAIEEDSDKVEGEIGSGDSKVQFRFEADPSFVDWLHTYCSADAWGGLVESKEPSLEHALQNHAAAKYATPLSPDRVVIRDGQALSMLRLLEDFDRELVLSGGPALELASLWRRFVELRADIVEHLDYLLHFPLTWLAGKPQLSSVVEDYLHVSATLYHRVQSNYRQMVDLGRGSALAILEALLTLDICQVNLQQEDGLVSHKAILMPTHPLHLWRYQRLVAVLRGLGPQITDADREAILKVVMRPDQFLSVVRVGTLPDGRGADQALPVSNDLHGLATFENLINAYTGSDGIIELARTLERYTILWRHHARPLHLAVVNPPEPAKLLAALVGILNRHRETTLPSIRVDLYCTPAHIQRIASALRFSAKDREPLEDSLSSGRLQLKIHEKACQLRDLVPQLVREPCHVLAIFDEASIFIRRGSLGQALPMSPFCVRQQIRYYPLEQRLVLEPTTDEPPFSEFMQLINEADAGQRDSSPHAWADAEGLRSVIDATLQGAWPASQWTLVADRALPTEAGMQSVRLLQRREGQRQLLLAARDYGRFVSLVQPIFEGLNLSLSGAHLRQMLEEGVNLIGAGLLELIRTQDGRADPNGVRGLAGLLIAARDIRRRYPDALIVSVDNEVARLWLRLGRRSTERADLLVLRQEGDGFVIECIEVKTTERGSVVDGGPIMDRAQEQIQATLTACALALPDNLTARDPLSAPRCEMLKEVFVRACQSRVVQPELRAKWASWLKELFQQTASAMPLKYQGEIINVLLGSNEQSVEIIRQDAPYRITLRALTESRIQELIDADTVVAGSGPIDNARKEPEGSNRDPEPAIKPQMPGGSGDSRQSDGGAVLRTSPSQKEESSSGTAVRRPSDEPQLKRKAAESGETTWPPQLNALGMIGQVETAAQLINQVNWARARGARMTDKLLVGPAGVGKSTIARSIAQRLGEEAVLFNGADLRSPSTLITKLAESGKLPRTRKGVVKVKRCVIFIDEVHAVSNQVATTLLSILEDPRITSVDAVNYDFSEVPFMLATTDPGKLSEAFNTRPDRTLLQSYSLQDVAGIVWLHGREALQDYELPEEVCREIAARVRCSPRRAVRALTEQLIPHVYSRTHKPTEKANLKKIANGLTLEVVRQFFDSQGIDLNGLDNVARNYIAYLRKNGATAAERLKQALGISNRSDFTEVDEYLVRLGLVSVSAAGRTLTRDGSKYSSQSFDLRSRISRQLS